MSRTDHPRIGGTHRALSKYDRYWWEPGYSEAVSHKRYAWFVTDAVAIAEGLAEMDDRPVPWWDWSPERELEERVIQRSEYNAWLLEGLALLDWQDLPDGHVSHLRLVDSGWSDPDDPDYWEDEGDEDEDLDEWERVLLGLSA